MKNDAFKILTIKEWISAKEKSYIETKLDNKDGFIHLSSSGQLALSLELYFQNDEILVLLQINIEKLQNKIVYETADNSSHRKGKFPHLYDKLHIDDVLKTWNIQRKAFQIPNEILIEAEKKHS